MKAFLTKLWAKLALAFHEAKGKLTTYVALITAALSELLSSWDQSAALFPKWLLDEKQHIVAALALLMIWTRIRRQLKPA